MAVGFKCPMVEGRGSKKGESTSSCFRLVGRVRLAEREKNGMDVSIGGQDNQAGTSLGGRMGREGEVGIMEEGWGGKEGAVSGEKALGTSCSRPDEGGLGGTGDNVGRDGDEAIPVSNMEGGGDRGGWGKAKVEGNVGGGEDGGDEGGLSDDGQVPFLEVVDGSSEEMVRGQGGDGGIRDAVGVMEWKG